MPGAADPEIASQFLTNALRHLRMLGRDPDPYIRRFALPDGAEQDYSVRVPVSVVRAAGEAISSDLQDPFLGLNIVRRLNRGSFGLLEYIFRSAATCRDVLREFVQYALLVNSVMDITFREDGGEGVFNHVITCDSPDMAGRHASEYTVALVINIGRELSGVRLCPRRAWFCHERPADTSELEAFFGCPLEFKAGANGLLASREVLDLPVRSADPVLHAILETQAQQEVRSRAPHADFLGQVQEQIQVALPGGGAPGVEQVASRLKMSSRTLQRRLAEQNKTFERVVDDARRDAALLLLEDPRKTLAEVSFQVGYSDVRAFTRAFKRWTGKAPGGFRRRGPADT